MTVTIKSTAPASEGGAVSASVKPERKPETREAKPPPTRKLPTDRIKFKTQLDILRAYGALSQSGTRAVNYRDVAKLVKFDANTITLLSAFLLENSLIERIGNDFMPAKPLVDFALAHSWGPDTAARKMAPALATTWFGESMRAKLSFSAIPEQEAITALGQEINAGLEWKPRIAILIDYLEAANLLRREGNLLVGVPGEIAASPAVEASPMSERPTPSEPRDDPPSRTAQVATSFMSAEGAIQFAVTIRVTMAEMGTWSPDRIAAFFAGLAKVLAAKKGTEEV